MGQSSVLPAELLISNKTWKIAIVKALFNQHITDKLETSCLNRLKELGFNDEQVSTYPVAGALEVPLVLDWTLTNGYDAAIALGAVIRGETTHYEYVCNGVERGCMSVQLSSKKPIAQAVLTVESEEQALDRCGGKHGDKGQEAVDVVVSMLNIKKKIL